MADRHIEGITKEENPMPEVPEGAAWREGLQIEDIITSVHELPHAFVAHRHDVDFINASINADVSQRKRGGMLLAAGGDYEIEDLMVVTAAGSYFSPYGNESDREEHEKMRKITGGEGFDSSLEKARTVMGSLTKDEWRTMVQIFAYMREITREDIPRMIRRARYDLNRGITPDERQFTEALEEIHRKVNNSPNRREFQDDFFQENIGDGLIKLYIERNGKVLENSVEIVCGLCGMTDGHSPDCQLLVAEPKAA